MRYKQTRGVGLGWKTEFLCSKRVWVLFTLSLSCIRRGDVPTRRPPQTRTGFLGPLVDPHQIPLLLHSGQRGECLTSGTLFDVPGEFRDGKSYLPDVGRVPRRYFWFTRTCPLPRRLRWLKGVTTTTTRGSGVSQGRGVPDKPSGVPSRVEYSVGRVSWSQPLSLLAFSSHESGPDWVKESVRYEDREGDPHGSLEVRPVETSVPSPDHPLGVIFSGSPSKRPIAVFRVFTSLHVTLTILSFHECHDYRRKMSLPTCVIVFWVVLRSPFSILKYLLLVCTICKTFSLVWVIHCVTIYTKGSGFKQEVFSKQTRSYSYV